MAPTMDYTESSITVSGVSSTYYYSTSAHPPYNTSYTITANNTDHYYNFDLAEIVLRARVKEVREGWNNPRQQPLPVKPIIVNNIRKCNRSNI